MEVLRGRPGRAGPLGPVHAGVLGLPVGDQHEGAPWYVVPADHKWVTRAVVADVITTTLRSLGLKYPEVTDEKRKGLAEAKRQLEAE